MANIKTPLVKPCFLVCKDDSGNFYETPLARLENRPMSDDDVEAFLKSQPASETKYGGTVPVVVLTSLAVLFPAQVPAASDVARVAPEPGTLVLVGAALAGIGVRRLYSWVRNQKTRNTSKEVSHE
jgi:hypothetical protein